MENRHFGLEGPNWVLVMTVWSLTFFFFCTALWSESLRPSRASLNRQNESARLHDYTFLRDPAQLREFVRRGWLIPVQPNADFQLKAVAFPYARPEVELFVRRLSNQYRAACGEQLVVTSLTRPKSHQPKNASKRSVHPTGMALDLRRPESRTCRRWLEKTLLYLEGRWILEVSAEFRPPHYHLALFPRRYRAYVDGRVSARKAKVTVLPGDSLWKIARQHKTTVHRLKAINALRSETIRPGQILRLK